MPDNPQQAAIDAAVQKAVDAAITRFEQTTAAAVAEQVKVAQARAAADPSQTAAAAEKLYDVTREAKADEAQKPKPQPRARFDVTDADARDQLSDELRVRTDTKTRNAFQVLARGYEQSRAAWEQKFPGDPTANKPSPRPIDVLMRGALVPERVSIQHGTGVYTCQNLKALTFEDGDGLIRRAWDLNDACYLWSLQQQVSRRLAVSPEQAPWYPELRAQIDLIAKAMYIGGQGNWIPTGFSADVIARYDMERNLTRYIPWFQMPRNPFTFPGFSTIPALQKVSEQSSDPESATVVPTATVTDTILTLTLVNAAIRFAWSDDLADDSILPMLDIVRQEAAAAWAAGEESAILNGDTSSPARDTDIDFSTTDIRKLFDGLRDLALTNSYYTAGGGVAVCGDLLGKCMSDMGAFGANLRDSIWVCGPKQFCYIITSLKDNATSANSIVVTVAQQGQITPKEAEMLLEALE